jgi:hypothetical protein
MEINKEIMEKAGKILAKKDDVTSKLALATNKVKELREQLEVLEPQIVESFGSSDISVLEARLGELTKEVEGLLEQVNKG